TAALSEIRALAPSCALAPRAPADVEAALLVATIRTRVLAGCAAAGSLRIGELRRPRSARRDVDHPRRHCQCDRPGLRLAAVWRSHARGDHHRGPCRDPEDPDPPRPPDRGAGPRPPPSDLFGWS